MLTRNVKKYQKEIRWLIFLVIPLLIFFALHFLIPLGFIIQSFPIVKDSYLASTIEQEQTSIRSFSITSQQKLISLFTGFTTSQKTFLNLLLQNSSRIMSVKSQELQLNNAYNLTHTPQESAFNQNLPMWYSSGILTQSQLPASLQSALSQYKSVVPFINPLFFSRTDGFIYSCSLYMVSTTTSESIYLQYPSSSQDARFQQLNSQVQDIYYNFTVGQKEGTYVPFLDQTDNRSSLLVLCTPTLASDFSIVACLKLNLQSLGSSFIKQRFCNGGAETALYSFILLSNDIGTQNSLDPQIILSLDNSGKGSFSTRNGYFNLKQQEIPSQIFSAAQNSLNQNVYITQSNLKTLLILPIPVTVGSNQSIPLHLMIENIIKVTTGAGDFISETIKAFLPPLLISIALAAFMSICVMKNLLDSVDLELTQLEQRCNFIADGDIDVEIIDYEGTQDIKDIYNVVRIINKLHRYSSGHYFQGHYSEKLLKYSQALQFLKKLNYDTGNILENMGECYTYVEEWDKATQVLKESVKNIQDKILEQFGTLDEMMRVKATRKATQRYKELELVLNRRLFRLNYVLLKYLELKLIFTKEFVDEKLEQEEFQRKRKAREKDLLTFLSMQRKTFYPNYAHYSQCIILLMFECKLMANMKKLPEAKALLAQASTVLKRYNAEYDKTTELLREKGSKYKLFHRKNKMTGHSRAQPEILNILLNIFRAKIALVEIKSPQKYIEAINILIDGIKCNLYTLSLMYLSVLEVRRLLLELKIDPTSYESIQLFRQIMPFKTLYYGEITKEIEPSLLRFAQKTSPGLERQFAFSFDCGKQFKKEGAKSLAYQVERVDHIFNKLVKPDDRVSILKYNTKLGITVECSLTIKKQADELLKKCFDQVMIERNTSMEKEGGLIDAVNRVFLRLKHLKCEKVAIFFLRSIEQYEEKLDRYTRKLRKKSSMYSKQNMSPKQKTNKSLQLFTCNCLGSVLQQSLQQEGIRNFKIIFYCSKNDSIQAVRDYFDLDNINQRIWSKTGGLNLWNNMVYVMQQKHKADIDRILMLKAQDLPDNSVFVL